MKYPLTYKDRETGKVEVVEVESDSPSLIELGEKCKQVLEGKSVEWAFLPAGDWIIAPGCSEKSPTEEPRGFNTSVSLKFFDLEEKHIEISDLQGYRAPLHATR